MIHVSPLTDYTGSLRICLCHKRSVQRSMMSLAHDCKYLPELYLVQLGLLMVQPEILQIQDLILRKRSSEN